MDNKSKLEYRIKNLFWDTTDETKVVLTRQILENPLIALKVKSLMIKVLTGLSWFDINRLVSVNQLYDLLNEEILNSLFPKSLGNYYRDAKRLLSKYFISPA